jgi:hypothetical protein
MSSTHAPTVPAGFRDGTVTSIREQACARSRYGLRRGIGLLAFALLALAALGCNESRLQPSASGDAGDAQSALDGAPGVSTAGMNAAAGAPPSAAGNAGFAAITTASPLDSSSPLVRTPACTDQGWEFAPGFLLARSVDYVADILDSAESRVDDATGVLDFNNTRVVYSASGVPCATAHDRASCLASLAILTGFGRQLVTTSGDEVHFWTFPSEFDLLGEIDTPAEALWVLAAGNNYYLPCGTTTVTAVVNGWAVKLPPQPRACAPAPPDAGPMALPTVLVSLSGQVTAPNPNDPCSFQLPPPN